MTQLDDNELTDSILKADIDDFDDFNDFKFDDFNGISEDLFFCEYREGNAYCINIFIIFDSSLSCCACYQTEFCSVCIICGK